MSLGQVTKGFLMLLIIAVSVKQGGLNEDSLEKIQVRMFNEEGEMIIKGER